MYNRVKDEDLVHVNSVHSKFFLYFIRRYSSQPMPDLFLGRLTFFDDFVVCFLWGFFNVWRVISETNLSFWLRN